MMGAFLDGPPWKRKKRWRPQRALIIFQISPKRKANLKFNFLTFSTFFFITIHLNILLYWAEEKIQHCFEQVSGNLHFLTLGSDDMSWLNLARFNIWSLLRVWKHIFVFNSWLIGGFFDFLNQAPCSMQSSLWNMFHRGTQSNFEWFNYCRWR